MIDPGPWRPEFDAALEAVREGASLARDIHARRQHGAFLKADRSPVTVADFAVQALIAYRLRQTFPDELLVAEEDAASLRSAPARVTLRLVLDALQSVAPDLDDHRVLDAIDRGRGVPGERFWTLDPIDGTRGFIRGGQYAVALALIVRGHVVLGLLGCPELADHRHPGRSGSIACAIRNQGAFGTSLAAGGEFTPLHVSSCREPGRARVLRSFDNAHIDSQAFGGIVRTMGVASVPTLMDSQAKYAAVAAGQAELMIRVPATRHERDKVWDHAAGTLIVEEAGGRVTDLHGAPLDFSAGRVLSRNDGVLASNAHLHAAALRAVRRVVSHQ